MTDTETTDKPATQADRECTPMFDRPISHDEARQAAMNFIDAHFKNAKGKGVRTSVPVQADDDDILLTDYIRQQRKLNAAKDATIAELVDALDDAQEFARYQGYRDISDEWKAIVGRVIAEKLRRNRLAFQSKAEVRQ